MLLAVAVASTVLATATGVVDPSLIWQSLIEHPCLDTALVGLQSVITLLRPLR